METEQRKLQKHNWYLANKEHIEELEKARYPNGSRGYSTPREKELSKIRRQRYVLNNPEKVREQQILRRDRKRQFKRDLVVLFGGKCERCGYNENVVALDFDHIDPSQKSRAIGELTSWNNRSLALEEVKKCRLLCSNCHRIRTHDPDSF